MDHSHLEIGPLYCETPFIAAAYPLEVINTLTSLIPAALGLVALWWLWRKKEPAWSLYVLSFFLFATGIGSALWHALRTPLSLSVDVFPGLVYLFMLVFMWPTFLKNRFWGYGTLAGLVAAQFAFAYLLPFGESNGPPISVFLVVTLFAVGLIYLTFKFAHPAAWLSVLMISCGLAAAFFRTIDLETCSVISFGTHFLWHVFLGAAGFIAIIMLSRIRSYRKDSENES